MPAINTWRRGVVLLRAWQVLVDTYVANKFEPCSSPQLPIEITRGCSRPDARRCACDDLRQSLSERAAGDVSSSASTSTQPLTDVRRGWMMSTYFGVIE